MSSSRRRSRDSRKKETPVHRLLRFEKTLHSGTGKFRIVYYNTDGTGPFEGHYVYTDKEEADSDAKRLVSDKIVGSAWIEEKPLQ